MDEAKLARRLRRGDRLALDRAMEAYTPYLTAVVWRALGPGAAPEDVEEVVSDAFLALWRSRDRLEPERGVKSYLAAVARNAAIDRVRRSSPACVPLEDAAPRARAVSGPEEEVERAQFAAALWRAVEALEPPDSQLVFRFYYEGERLKDVAADLGLSVPAAKTRLHRARKKLKEQLQKGWLADDTV